MRKKKCVATRIVRGMEGDDAHDSTTVFSNVTSGSSLLRPGVTCFATAKTQFLFATHPEMRFNFYARNVKRP